MAAEVGEVLARARRALIPPPRLNLPDWIEANIRLPDGLSAAPGPVRLWPFQRGIAEAVGDPGIERVTLVKPVRVGFTTLLTSAVAAYVANDPAPILCLLPAEADCRDYMVSDLEPTFAASPVVERALSHDQAEGERNTILSRRFPGGSLKIVAAKSPRNLRRHTARVLFIDEADGMEATPEGSPILLAERRTISFPDRKIVLGSTPVFEETSHVLRAYGQSDKRVFEVPCPECGEFNEIAWQHIRWPEGRPEEAAWCCPGCGVLVPETAKPGMVAAGRWRATAPEVRGHAGFRLNALISLHENASWGRLAAEFLAARNDPTTLQTFVNTILAEGWRGEGDELSEHDLASQAEDFGISAIPAEVLAVTAGVDVQHDRIEATFVGWQADNVPLVLGHRVIWGRYDDQEVWSELGRILKASYPSKRRVSMEIDAAAVDAGDGVTMDRVIRFCRGAGRRVMAIKGAHGHSRPMIERSESKSHRGSLFIVGVDAVKQWLFARLSRPGRVRFSADLPPVWFEQLTSERAVVRYRRGQPVRSFERIGGRQAEALDCMVYAVAARQVIGSDVLARRAVARPDTVPPPAVVAPRPRWTPAAAW